ncbi:MAG TPA: hypothetical protein VFV03_01755, partial [Solirubrobacteraceae bacterium]|nr:hypothetical protein [Solirubrobacteraceae bacterium]
KPYPLHRVGEDGEIQAATIEKPYARIIAPRIIRRRADKNATSRPNPALRWPNADPVSLGPAFDLEQIGAP